MNNETQLLQTLSAIADKFEKDIRQNGELFNVYSLLNIEHRENETHSILLADLLSPDGTHGQGKLFLDLFVETLTGEKHLFNKDVKVYREHFIGKINEDYTEGGRIDILITDGKTTWIIENKIYAKDQENQLLRYKNAFPKAKIIYLKPAEYEECPNPEIVDNNISYEKKISEWLEKIINNLEHKEYLRNSIKQYYNLVQNISFTGYTQKMNTEIQKEIEANLEAAFKIKEQFDNVIFELYKVAFENLTKPYIECGEYEIIQNSYFNFTFTKEKWKQTGLAISFRFDDYNKNFSGLYTGIYKLENEELNENILNQLNTKTNESIINGLNWPLYNYPFGKQSLYDLEIAKKLQNGEFQEVIIQELEKYEEILDDIIA